VYNEQSGSSTTVRHKEHVRYVRTNNPVSANALHILDNKDEYGTAAETLTLRKTESQRHTYELLGNILYASIP
jgi:hypothetical protein